MDLKQQLAAKDIERAKLQQALAGGADQVAWLQQQVVAENQKLAKSKQQLAAKGAHIASLQEHLKAKEDDIAGLQQQLLAKEQELAGLRQQLEAKVKDSAGLKQQLSTTFWRAFAVVCVLGFSVRNPVCKQGEGCIFRRRLLEDYWLTRQTQKHQHTRIFAGGVRHHVASTQAFPCGEQDRRRLSTDPRPGDGLQRERDTVADLRPNCTGRSRVSSHPSRAALPAFDI